MIDFHTHILPGMDDGSRDVHESLQALTLEDEQGVQEILLTPHFYAHIDKVSSFLERREHSFRKLTKALNEHDMGTPFLYGRVRKFIIFRELGMRSKFANSRLKEPIFCSLRCHLLSGRMRFMWMSKN